MVYHHAVASDRRLRKFIRQWRRRYPFPVDWVDDRANKQCRRSEKQWLVQFDRVTTLKRRQTLSLIFWKFGGSAHLMEQAVKGIDSPSGWGHARRQIKKALVAPNATQALDCLAGPEEGISGWGPEVASVVLSACRPDTFTVVHDRSLRTLKALELFSPSVEGQFDRSDWWPYLRECKRLAQLCGRSLREVDQALWAAADDAPSLPKPPKRVTRKPPAQK
ncbi:MAG TPA: hypothetical protein VMR97_05155 [Acidimicrobiales bacterium]|nr:hypothetical protein [Acidimicrobiales bacterium]